MAKKENRVTIGLKCEECNEINYSTKKNKINTTGKLELNKFCPKCNKRTLHKEKK